VIAKGFRKQTTRLILTALILCDQREKQEMEILVRVGGKYREVNIGRA
jgi:hypothetical protein